MFFSIDMIRIELIGNGANLTTLDATLWEAQHAKPDAKRAIMTVNKVWFQDKLKDLGISQRRLAKKIDLDPAAVSYMLAGTRRITMDEAKKIAEVMLVPVTEVMRQAGIEVLDDVKKVPIAGHINARGVVTLLPAGTEDHVIAPADVPAGSFCLQMRTVNSVHDGWLYFVSGQRTEPTFQLDRLCVVALNDGAIMLSVLKRGYKADLFNLVVLADNVHSVLENKSVSWATRVLWILPT